MGDSSAPRSRLVVCLGASIVEGRVSASFVDLLAQRLGAAGFRFVNAGVAGSLAYDVLRRLDTTLAQHPAAAIVLVGSNDVTNALNPALGRFARWSRRLPQAPTADWYRECMAELVRRLKAGGVGRIALCSLPPMGEDLASTTNVRVRAYNAILAEVAGQEQVAYLPVYEAQAEYLRRQRPAGGPPFDPGAALGAGLKLLFYHFLLGYSLDRISQRNGFLLTAEGQHMNGAGAALIADQIEPFLRAS